MNTAIRVEAHDHLAKRLAVERTELAKEIKAKRYWRAASIANYIALELKQHAENVERRGS